MSSGKKHKPWSDRVHESVVSRNKSGQLNLVIKGGAEEGRFPYFGPVKQDKVIYHSGKIQDGEILLEVNDQSIVGLTLYDLNNLIKHAPDPVRFKSVKEGQSLVKDLKIYLNQRFDKGSVDHQLQAAIRDNLYLRTLPCTTRKLRNGETDGVDYTFLSVEEFKKLENSGALLESGVYEGNYYGTPKPPPVPLSPPIVRRSNSATDLPALHPSSDGKRKRNRSNVEMLNNRTSAPHTEALTNDESELKPTEPVPSVSQAVFTNGDLSSSLEQSETNIEDKIQHSEKVLGPLPEGWEMSKTPNGDYYFIDHLGKKTSWVDPRLENLNRKKLEECDDDELPYGWEKVTDDQYGTYYVDHINEKTQFANPVLEAKNKIKEESTAEALRDTTDRRSPAVDEGASDVPEAAADFSFTKDPAQLQGEIHQVPIEKSAKGFGFTIVGGDDPEEFLQIKSVVPRGAADLTGNIVQGDIIVKVNDKCVLGWTHSEVVKLFQTIPVGQIVTLELCRGYPMFVDTENPDTKMLSTYAIRPDDNPTEEFQRQLRMLNSQLERNDRDDFYSGMENMNLSNPSKSLPDITMEQNLDSRGFYGYSDLPNPRMFTNQNMYARSGSMGTLPSPIVVQIIVHKGDEGFGFTIADSPRGQKVKQILDGSRCRDLIEGDVLIEINGIAVQNMPHNNVVQLLKDCPYNSAAIFVIQRGPNLPEEAAYGLPPGSQVNLMNGPSPGVAEQYAYMMYGQNYVNRMKRSHTEPGGLHSENGSVVSAPPGNSMSHPVNAVLNEYRAKHADPSSAYLPPVSNAYPMYVDSQSMYHDPYTSSQPNYIHLNVILRREETGFGFRILGGNTHDETVTIGTIVPNGAADKDGTLRTGDELLTVDGQRVTRLGHNQVVALMGNAARNAIVQLGIRRRVGGTQMPTRPIRGPAQRQLGGPGSRPSSRGGPVINHSGQPFDLVIHRHENEGFGFVIISSVKTTGFGIQAPHKIGRIIDGSPADRCGQLRVGDRILAINNVDITQLHHGQIVNLIKDSGFAINIRVLPLANDDEDDVSEVQNNTGLKMVELHKWRKGFGFGIRGGREYNMPLYVLRVAEDGPAAESGQVQVGDILIEINGRSTVDIPHQQAINYIKQGGQTVRLLLKSGDGSVPEIESNPVGSVHSLSSSALSGSDATARRNHPPETEQTSPASKSPIKSPLSPFRGGQNFSKLIRRRANSSGQITPMDQTASPARVRRAVTPNPSLAYREAGISPENDFGDTNHSLMSISPNPDLAKGEIGAQKHLASDQHDFRIESNFKPSNSPTNNPRPRSPSQGDGSHPKADVGSKESLDEGTKKSKSGKKSKFGKAKFPKVGLWVSPKKK